MHFGFVNKD
jgi:hypothetical protein